MLYLGKDFVPRLIIIMVPFLFIRMVFLFSKIILVMAGMKPVCFCVSVCVENNGNGVFNIDYSNSLEKYAYGFIILGI